MTAPAHDPERERLVREVQEAESAFNANRSDYEHYKYCFEDAHSKMEISRILVIVRAEALRAYDARQEARRD